ETLRVTTSSGSEQKVEQALTQNFPQAQFKAVERQQVGAIVGKEIQRCAIVGVVHDVFLSIGCYCIANAVSGREFNATVVAAVLTIIGFSLNDKVVIFDRIRENLKHGDRGTFREVINQALTQTLSRTIITSGTVLIATLCLFIWGGGVINDFAFTFLIGIISGTYSSVFISSAFVLWWHKGER